MQTQDLRVVMVPTDELVPHEGNAKLHPVGQIDQIVSSIVEFGFSDPIGAWHDDGGNAVVVEGHGRLMAAKRLHMDEVPVIFLDRLTDEQRRAYGLVHNQLTMNSPFDWDLLTDELDSIAGIDMMDYGFDFDGLTEIGDDGEMYDDTDPDWHDEPEGRTAKHACPRCGYEW